MFFNQAAINYFLFLIFSCLTILARAEDQNPALDLSVEDLLNVQVTSVAKKAQSLNDAPAAVFVISNEDIKRSGVTSIPDALRLAPGLDVARIDANQWAVSSRGFNGRFADKLQVLIDGRTAYTRSFAGVYWENQDVMMEDIDRIEVIRGSGATLWGANAVNGVINVITKHSAKTQGGSLNAGGGTFEQEFGAARYGVKWGEDTTARAYVKGFNRGDNTLESGGNAGDSWHKTQGGFRLDSQLSYQDALTVQGDIYRTEINQQAYYPQLAAPYQLNQQQTTPDSGGNLLSRLQHSFSPTSEYKLQAYFDSYSQHTGFVDDNRDTLDLDFQHRFLALDSHEIIWGAGYRYGHDRIVATPLANGQTIFTLNPTSVNDQLISGFVQDEMSLIDNRLKLTIGSKFEHNDYSGFEGQPSAKIIWSPQSQHRLWAGVSRAVRTPSRGDKVINILESVTPLTIPPSPMPIPLAAYIQGNANYGSEEVISYETGYRTTFIKAVSLDITGFYNDYRNLQYTQPTTPNLTLLNGSAYLLEQVGFTNQEHGRTYGVEIATVWQMLDWWRWDFNYSWLRTEISNPAGVDNTANSPQHRSSLRGLLSPRADIDLDFWFRYVDSATVESEFNNYTIPAYVTLDLRTAWRPAKNLELSLTGQNLLQASHLEYVAETQTFPTAIVRGVYGKISWNF